MPAIAWHFRKLRHRIKGSSAGPETDRQEYAQIAWLEPPMISSNKIRILVGAKLQIKKSRPTMPGIQVDRADDLIKEDAARLFERKMMAQHPPW
jgi:hypothetical protein